jgi:hypothetical protein
VKKVRYLAGIAGLAPVAAAFMAPTAAHAATQGPATNSGSPVKVVSLHHAGKRTDGSCPGTRKKFHWHNNHVSTSAYVSKGGCIGTVYVKIYGSNVGECFYPQLHIYSPVSTTAVTWQEHCSPDLDTVSIGLYSHYNFPIGIYGKGYNTALGDIAGPAGGTVKSTSF